MTVEQPNETDPKIQRALSELQQLIRDRYPSASFAVYRGEDPAGIYLGATVDIEDTDEVVDVFIDRLLDLQVEEHLPVYVVTSRPVERVLEGMRSAKAPRRYRVLGSVTLNP